MKAAFVLIGFGYSITPVYLCSQEGISNRPDELAALLQTKVEVGSKLKERLYDAPGIISVLSSEELQRFGGTSLSEVLNRVPGLLHISNYFTDRSIMGSRGDALSKTCTNRHVLVLFDGRPIREVQEGGIKSDVYEAFPLDAIDRIEVIKGPGSVLYGSEAFSGVINIVTKKSKENSSSLFGSAGERGAFHHSFKVGMASNDFSLLVAGRQAKRPDWPVRYSATDKPNGSEVAFTNHTFVDSSEGVFGKFNYQNLQIMGSFLRWKPSYSIPDMVKQPPPLGTNDLDLQKTFIDVGYLYNFNNKWKMSLNATFNRSQFNCITDAFPDINRNSSEMLSEMTHFITLSGFSKLTTGGWYSYVRGFEHMNHQATTVSRGSRRGYAGYAQADFQFLENFKGIGGFQTIKIGESAVKTVPRLGFVWYPTDKINVKLLYGEAFRAPYVNEAMADFIGLKGNSTLKPEIVTAHEASVTYLGGHIELGISGFRNTQKNLISYARIGEGSPNAYRNESEPVTIEGAEFEGKYYFNQALFLTGSLLAQRCKEVPTGISNRGGKFGISYSGAQGVVSLFSVIQGDVPEELHNRNSINPQAGSYCLVSLHAELDLNKTFNWTAMPRIKVTLHGNNLLDKEIWVNAVGNGWPQETIPFIKGRAVYIGARFSY